MVGIDISQFLGQFWGWAFLIIGLIYLIRKKEWIDEVTRHTMGKDYTAITGHFYLFLGLATVVLHNIWVSDWRLIVTMIGWFMLIRGTIRLSFPGVMKKSVSKKAHAISRASLFLFVLIGAWLVWASW